MDTGKDVDCLIQSSHIPHPHSLVLHVPFMSYGNVSWEKSMGQCLHISGFTHPAATRGANHIHFWASEELQWGMEGLKN